MAVITLNLQSLLSVLRLVVDHIAMFSALGLCHSLCTMVFHIIGVEFPCMREQYFEIGFNCKILLRFLLLS